jgi:two-component system phosphate regulon response regulator PhoB
VLLYGQDPAYGDLLSYVLEAEGYQVRQANIPHARSDRRAVPHADVVVLDLGSTGHAQGRLRRSAALCTQSGTPLVLLVDDAAAARALRPLLGDRGQAVVRARGARGIVLAVREVLAGGASPPAAASLRYADLHMDTSRYRVTRAGQEIHLTPAEFRLLKHFLAHPEHVLTRKQLAQAAWPQKSDVGRRTVDVYVGRLRRALTSAAQRDLIRTVWSIGYALTAR